MGVGYIHATIFGLILLKAYTADPVLAANLSSRQTRPLLLQDSDNPLFSEPWTLHPSVSLLLCSLKTGPFIIRVLALLSWLEKEWKASKFSDAQKSLFSSRGMTGCQ